MEDNIVHLVCYLNKEASTETKSGVSTKTLPATRWSDFNIYDLVAMLGLGGMGAVGGGLIGGGKGALGGGFLGALLAYLTLRLTGEKPGYQNSFWVETINKFIPPFKSSADTKSGNISFVKNLDKEINDYFNWRNYGKPDRYFNIDRYELNNKSNYLSRHK